MMFDNCSKLKTDKSSGNSKECCRYQEVLCTFSRKRLVQICVFDQLFVVRGYNWQLALNVLASEVPSQI